MKKYLPLILFLAINMFSRTCFSQPWIGTYNGPGNGEDRAYAIVIDGSGNTYVTGFCTSLDNGFDFLTIKYNPEGVLQWTNTYNGSGNGEDRAHAITVDGSGNIYVTGYSTGAGSGYDITTVKYTSNGEQLWAARYNGQGNGEDAAYAIVVDGSGNIYVTGYSSREETGCDYCTIKYDSNGNMIWVRIYSGSEEEANDKAYAITVDSPGNIYITGFCVGEETGANYTTIKYNPNGVIQWAAVYNGAANGMDIACGIAVNGSSIYVTGHSEGEGTGKDYATIKYNSNGEQLWVKRYNGPGNNEDMAYDIAVANNNDVLVTGSSRSGSQPGTEDYATIRYQSNGNENWVERYNGTGDNIDIAYSLYLTPSNNSGVYITGTSRSSNLPGSEDMVTIKYIPGNGNISQITRFNGISNSGDFAYDIVVDNNDDIRVAGYTTRTGDMLGTSSNYDFVTLAYEHGQLTEINAISGNVPKDFKLYQNYPNPFNPSTIIKFDIINQSNVKLIVYDVLGKEAAVLVNEFLRAGSYEVKFSAAKLSSGVYFYEIKTDGFSDMKKMILMK
ncbi:MAG: SBBP repeat-containing protein [Ignavibacteria bacterium]